MTYKQAMGLLYAINEYLDVKDNEWLTKEGCGEYFRGLRGGACEVIDDISKIMVNYHFNAKKRKADTPQTDIVFYDYDPNTDDVRHLGWNGIKTDCGWK